MNLILPILCCTSVVKCTKYSTPCLLKRLFFMVHVTPKIIDQYLWYWFSLRFKHPHLCKTKLIIYRRYVRITPSTISRRADVYTKKSILKIRENCDHLTRKLMDHKFSNLEEEIYFFKEIKPLLFSKLFYLSWPKVA